MSLALTAAMFGALALQNAPHPSTETQPSAVQSPATAEAAAPVAPAPESVCAAYAADIAGLIDRRAALEAQLSGGVRQTEVDARVAGATMQASQRAAWAAGAAAMAGGGFGGVSAVNATTRAAMLAQQANSTASTARIAETVAALGDIGRRLHAAETEALQAGCPATNVEQAQP